MSSGPNHRRGHGRIQDHGPTWEGNPPASGCNSTHVARSRSKWKKRKHRAFRRTDGRSTGKARHLGHPDPEWDRNEHEEENGHGPEADQEV